MIDRFQEINKDAALRVSSALSRLTGKETEVSFTLSQVTEPDRIIPPEDAEKMVIGIYIPIKVQVSGETIIILDQDSALILSDLLLKRKPRRTHKLFSIEESALKETGNIIMGNYLTVLSNVLKVEIIEGLPSYRHGMLGAILEQVITNFSKNSMKALVIEVQFIIKQIVIKGYLYILLDSERINELCLLESLS